MAITASGAVRRRTILERVVSRLCGEDGSALMEFAVSLPLMAVMLVGGSAAVVLVQARFAVQVAAREAATIGGYVGTTVDPYNTTIAEARAGAERVLLDHGLALEDATITFDGTSETLERGSLFQVQIEYGVTLPLVSARFLGQEEDLVFTVRSVAVLPIQQYQARWPCPSDDPLCN